ncbi:hypothetical protein SAMN05192534_12314 [Alteribacillus persepolensis]|uniref:Uncharacterized protein n=1 Tax=Alteribacillus persepolensis TaxID=568899 RepID=A0A1G8I6F1_9BACI|nr:hypothetical protein [Alteribacillus persepolensis]SDI14549.1 hypothetical protein SAMN05192534_12314 [Alteribacillus persepolensis]
MRCCSCGKEYSSMQAEIEGRLDCDCGGGLVEDFGDEDFFNFMNEYDSDGF